MKGLSILIHKNKKAQIWSLDLMIAFVIFIFVIILFGYYSVNISSVSKQPLKELLREGNVITNSLLSAGYPSSWNSENVQRIGIMDDGNGGRVNLSKLNALSQIALEDYVRTKSLFHVRDDYYFFFEQDGIVLWINEAEGVEGIGKPGVNSINVAEVEDPRSLINLVRYVSYEERPTLLVLYMWEKD